MIRTLEYLHEDKPWKVFDKDNEKYQTAARENRRKLQKLRLSDEEFIMEEIKFKANYYDTN